MNISSIILILWGGRRCSDRMVVRFTTTFCNRCRSPLMWVRLLLRARCTTLCDKVCQWLARGRWFSPGSPIWLKNSSTMKPTNQPTYSLVYFSEIVFVRFNAWLPPLLFFFITALHFSWKLIGKRFLDACFRKIHVSFCEKKALIPT